MKSILISIKPKYVADILNERKTSEVRKTEPNVELPIDVYIYCTKEEYLYRTNKGYIASKKPLEVGKGTEYSFAYSDEGMVVAKFTLNKVEEIKNNLAMRFFTESADEKELLDKSCLNSDQLFWYLAPQELKVKCCGYAWHISNLVIFDKPKELSEFNSFQRAKAKDCGFLKQCKNCGRRFNRCHLLKPLTKAPQSFMYVEVK